MGLETSPQATKMAVWETDDEMSPPVKPSLAARVESRTPSRGSRTPSRSSKKSRRSVTPPGRISTSPPQMPGSDKTDKSDRVRRDTATDENISILDPRRFTPTLHANLVSEILTLRRDQEDKLKVIENLETSLQSTREEEDAVQTTLQSTAKENRSLKRQLALLEGGTSSALGELARERDEAIDLAAETRRKFEAAQKKLKSQEEDAGRAHDSWAREKDEWEEEKRKMERKIHVAETRLKTVLEEVAAFQVAQANGQSLTEDEADDRGRESDAGSVRSMSIRESVRFSLLNKGANGHSLADELDFDDDSDCQTDANGRDSVMSNHRHMRNDSRTSTRSKTHRRHHSGESLVRPGSVARGRFQTQLHMEGIRTNGIIQEDEEMQLPIPPKANYTDTGVQYSPPPSPKLPPSKCTSPEPSGVSALAARWEKHHEETSTEANQRKKRVSIAKPVTIQQVVPPRQMVPASVQTVDVPLSPPKTPTRPPPPPPPTIKPVVMISAATQTDAPTPPRPVTPPPTALTIPSIAIHPPTSRPSSPRQPRLPQLSKDFGCQVSLSEVPTSSIGVQTEEIRIDQRLDKLPAHLHPSAVTSRPSSPAEASPTLDTEHSFTPVPKNVPPRNPKRLTSQRSLSDIASSPRPSLEREATDVLFDSPGSAQSAARKTQRISSLFSTFHEASSADEIDDFAEADVSDTEYRTALSAPRAVKSPEPGRTTPSMTTESPEQIVPRNVSNGRENAKAPETAHINGFSKTPAPRENAVPDRVSSVKQALKPSAMASVKAGGMRKAAMIQNGIATHQEENQQDPPFPIPKRASSRQPLFSRAPSDGNRSPTRAEPWHRKGMRTSQYRANSLRKSRSAAPVPYGKNKGRRKNSRSPPYSPDMPHTPTIPPLPRNAKEFVTPKHERPRGRGHRHQHSGTTATTEVTQVTQATQATNATGTQSQTSSQAATGVVDAIAQTMVGEWMFKYVRRRKSFTKGADNSGRDDTSNDRHKRWVWLAPYERAILWSSKQPSSGSALLGKSGRKLTIQSVLDVKDDNPAPKGVHSVFNRSILILTPQRALKFTAVNAERHYLWLTSLSFLAHSQQDVPDIPVPAPAPKQAPEFEFAASPPQEPQEPRVRRPRIRDSIRLAKSHNPAFNRTTRPTGGLGSTMSSQNSGMNNAAVDRNVSPMPSIPDVPQSFVPGYRSPPPPAGTESVASGYSYPSNSSQNKQHERDLSLEVAEPPQVPRFSTRDRVAAPAPAVHGRKRSNTGGHVPPPLSFRGFSGGSPNFHHAPTNSQSTGTGSSDYYSGGRPADALSVSGWGAQSTVSGRTSEASNRMSGNFFDAIGTVRMEAFISPLAYSRYESDGQLNYPDPMEESRFRARRRSKEIRRKKSRSRSRQRGDRDSLTRGTRGWGRDDYYGGHRTAGEEESASSRRDPFEGF